MPNATTRYTGEELVGALQRIYRGWSWIDGRIVLDDFTLESPPNDWPPRIRIDYRICGKPGQLVDESVIPVVVPLDAMAGLWVAFIYEDLVVLYEPRPEDRLD